jgi:FkbM family methyltransferase
MNETHDVAFTAAGKSLSLSFATAEDHIAQVIRQTGNFYEAEMLADARSRLFYPARAVDVGAHVGNHTVYFAHVLGVSTVSFEPNPVTFRHLAANVAANGLTELCTLCNLAVGAATDKARAALASAENSGMATVELDPQGPLEVVALDQALGGEPRIDLIKIDVEGWELDVLRGAAGILARHRPLLYVEVMQGAFEAVEGHLDAAGYQCWKRFNVTPTFLFLPRERLAGGTGAAITNGPANVRI